MLEFTAGVLSGEPPVYDGASIVALTFERGNLLPQQHFIADPAVQTLSAEDAQLDLGHVQPASMGGSVVKLQALGYTTRFGRSKCFVERAGLVGIEIVQHQPYDPGLGVRLVNQPAHLVSKVHSLVQTLMGMVVRELVLVTHM